MNTHDTLPIRSCREQFAKHHLIFYHLTWLSTRNLPLLAKEDLLLKSIQQGWCQTEISITSPWKNRQHLFLRSRMLEFLNFLSKGPGILGNRSKSASVLGLLEKFNMSWRFPVCTAFNVRAFPTSTAGNTNQIHGWQPFQAVRIQR